MESNDQPFKRVIVMNYKTVIWTNISKIDQDLLKIFISLNNLYIV